MNLEATIRLQAGGLGSGCRGSNCGRKKEAVGEARKIVKRWQKFYSNRSEMIRLAQMTRKGGLLQDFHPGSVIVHRGVSSNYSISNGSWSKSRSIAKGYAKEGSGKVHSLALNDSIPALDINKLLGRQNKYSVEKEVFVSS